MSRLGMSPAEPPSAEVAAVLELLRVARVEHGVITARVARISTWARDPMNDPSDRMKFRVARAARDYEARLWAHEIAAIEEQARILGVRP